MMMMDASKDEESTNVECPSVFIECVPAKPIGWRLLGALRNLPRFTVTLPLRAWEWFQSMTLVTFCTILFLLATYVMASLSFFDVKSVCMSTSKVLRLHQAYRLFFYGAFHSGPLHLFINLAFLSSVGKTVEAKLGSYYLINVLAVFSISCALLQMALELVVSLVYPAIMDQCLSGFPSILFGILVLAQRVTKSKKQSIYGLCYIPKMLYPWLLLVGCQLVAYKHISLTANLSGISIGYAYMHDLLNFVKLSPNMITNLERSGMCHWVSGLPGFVHYPSKSLVLLSSHWPSRSGEDEQRQFDRRRSARPSPSQSEAPSDSSSPSLHSKMETEAKTKTIGKGKAKGKPMTVQPASASTAAQMPPPPPPQVSVEQKSSSNHLKNSSRKSEPFKQTIV